MSQSNQQKRPFSALHDRPLGSIAAFRNRQHSADSVEKVAPLSGLRQNLCIGQQGSTQHDGTVIEWAGTAVLLVQP
jgi:hypothetical protein